MLRQLRIARFKSLADVSVSFPSLTVLFGPNAAGKSNLLDGIQALSRLGTSRTASEALAEPIRGHAIEAFAFPPGGLSELLSLEKASFAMDAQLQSNGERFRYKVEVAIHPASGNLSVEDEFLAQLNAKGETKGNPLIERHGDKLLLRRRSKPAAPRHEPAALHHTLLSDPRLGGAEYRPLEKARFELASWRVYYLDPRVAMRVAKAPAAVRDIGVLGEDIAPFLYRLRVDDAKAFAAVKRTVRSIIPSIEEIEVDLDKRRGTLDILIRQGGVNFSSRVISEGTLRVLALCTVAVNPWVGPLIAFEEPENGVHPRRIELIAQLLVSLARSRRIQVIATSHSPLFCDSILKEARKDPERIALLNVRRGVGGTEVIPFEVTGPLFQDSEIKKALSEESEERLFEALMARGMLDG